MVGGWINFNPASPSFVENNLKTNPGELGSGAKLAVGLCYTVYKKGLEMTVKSTWNDVSWDY